MFLTMDVGGPSAAIGAALGHARLMAEPVILDALLVSVAQVDAAYSRLTVEIPREQVLPLLSASDAFVFTVRLAAPYRDIEATGSLAPSRKALNMASERCVSGKGARPGRAKLAGTSQPP